MFEVIPDALEGCLERLGHGGETKWITGLPVTLHQRGIQ